MSSATKFGRPILPCNKCGTAEYVWAEPEKFGEMGRHTRYVGKCEKCGTRVAPSGFSGCETADEAMMLWNERVRKESKGASL